MAGLQPSPPSRCAVTLEPVLTRRDNARITCVAVDGVGQRFFLGLENGHLEEHRLVRARYGLVSRIAAEKRMFKKGILDLAFCAPAQRLLLLSEDHVVAMCTMETFDIAVLPGVKSAGAIACEPGRRLPCRIAVTTNATKKPKLLLFNVAAGLVASPTPGTAPVLLSAQAALPDAAVQQLAWVGDNILVALAGAYWLYRGGDSLVELSSNIPCPPLISPAPHADIAALLFTERLALLTDSSGAAIREPLVLPSRPLAVGHAGQFVVVVCDEGVSVYDRNSAQQVQSIDFLHDDPWSELHHRLACATEAGGNCMLLASSQMVWVLEPVALEQQVAELLKRHRFGVALDLIQSCARERAPWAPIAYAEAGMLMLQNLKFEEAMAAFELCTPLPFQPMELFPLFPVYAAQWLMHVPHKRYWGLANSSIMELSHMIEEGLELQRAVRSQGGLTELGSQAGGALAVVPFNLMGEPEAMKQLVAQFRLAAERSIVGYLQKVRLSPGVEHLSGVDTLIAHLLCDTDQEQLLEDFASASQQVVVGVIAPALMSAQRWHALALFRRQGGEREAALEIWRRLGQGEIKECVSASGAVSASGGDAAVVSARHTADLLRQQGPAGVGADVVLCYLPWLLNQDSELSMRVLKARELPVHAVQSLMDKRQDDLRWRYLEHVVQSGSCQEAALHTQLARNLVEAVLKLQHEGGVTVQHGGESASGVTDSSAVAGDDARHVSMLRQRLLTHLRGSTLYDAHALMEAVRDTELWEEQVELYRMLSAHACALRVLALTLHDMDGALLYCRQYAGQEGFLTLLEMCLNPGEGRDPMYSAALRVLDAEGADLNPVKVLHALGDSMPLHLAMDTLSRMLSSTLHRRRHLMISRSLHRAQNLNARVDKLEQECQRVVVTENTTCRACQRLLANKVFYRYPSGLIICNRCYKDPEQIAPSANGHTSH